MLSIMLNHLIMYSLSEKVVVNMQENVFTLEKLKMIPTIKNLIFMTVRYDAVENYLFLRDSQLVFMVGL